MNTGQRLCMLLDSLMSQLTIERTRCRHRSSSCDLARRTRTLIVRGEKRVGWIGQRLLLQSCRSQQMMLTCHEAAVASSCRVFAFAKFVHRRWEQSCWPRSRDVESAAAAVAVATLSIVLTRIQVVTSVRRAAFPCGETNIK